MKKELKGMGKVFSFTFSHQIHAKGYRVATWLLVILLLFVPAGIMAAVEWFGGGASEALATENPVQSVFVVDHTEGQADFSLLNQLGAEGYDSISYVSCDSMDEARDLADSTENSLILALDLDKTGYSVNLLLPEETRLDEAETKGLESFFNQNFQVIQLQKSGLTADQASQLLLPVQSEIVTGNGTGAGSPEKTPAETVKQVLSYVLPYACIMVLYFLVLFYGQRVANSVILEKNSKLMDTFLIAIKPSAMIFGKVFAVVAASILQFFLWIAALVGGFATGTALVKWINPETDMVLIQLFDSMEGLGSVFSLSGGIIALLMLLAGFLLYCSLASIGGSAAGKPEDLSSTNVLFTTILVVSFLCTLYAGGIGFMGGEESAAAWIDWVPFTAILVTPSRLLLGELSLGQGLASLGIVAASSLILLYLAGKVYQMMALYKGNPPTPSKLFRMMRGR